MQPYSKACSLEDNPAKYSVNIIYSTGQACDPLPCECLRFLLVDSSRPAVIGNTGCDCAFMSA